MASIKLSQVVLEVGEAAGEGIDRSATLQWLARLPGRTALGVGEHGVGLVHELEALLSHRIAAVEIRMPAAGLGPEGPLQGLGIGAGLEAQHGPVIGRCGGAHGAQTSPQGSLSSQAGGGAVRPRP